MFYITHFPKLLDSKADRRFQMPWKRLALTLTHPRPWTDKGNRELWSPAIFTEKRSKKDAIEASLLVFDIDEGQTLYTTEAKLKELKIQYILHTTASHTPQVHKYRVILPIWNPIKADIWKHYYSQALDWWEKNIGSKADPACKDISRAYYLSYGGEGYHASQLDDGDYLDFTELAMMDARHEEIQADKEKVQKELEIKNRQNYYDTRQKAHPSHTDWYKYMYNLFKTNEQERTNIAGQIGAQIIDGKAIDFNCPYCGRKDATFYYISPIPWSSAFCKHVNSCGTKGQITTFSLYHLASHNGLI